MCRDKVRAASVEGRRGWNGWMGWSDVGRSAVMRCGESKSKSESEGDVAAVEKPPSGDDNHGACLSSQAFFLDQEL